MISLNRIKARLNLPGIQFQGIRSKAAKFGLGLPDKNLDFGYTVDLQELTVLIVLLRALYVVNPNVKIRLEINPICLMR